MVAQKPDFQSVPLIRPKDLLGDLDVKPQALVIFSPSDWKLVLAHVPMVSGSVRNLSFSALHTIPRHNISITLAGPALGAPVAAMLLEVLIAFGARTVIALGSCGSIHEQLTIGQVIIPESAFSDEGVSAHYPLRGKRVAPSQKIVRELQVLGKMHGQKLVTGKIWTTDAPFRETPQKIKKFQQKQAMAVEMELSAFFKVGKFYGLEVGALLVVSDELFSRPWKSGYGTGLYKKSFLQAVEIAISLLAS